MKIYKMPFESSTYIVSTGIASSTTYVDFRYDPGLITVAEWLSNYSSAQYIIEPYGIIRFRDHQLETMFVLKFV